MKSNWLFYLSVAIDLLTIWLALSNYMLSKPFMEGEFAPPETEMLALGRMLPWLISGLIATLVIVGFGLRANGKLLAANILVCIPALPMFFAIVVCGGLAILFTFFGK